MMGEADIDPGRMRIASMRLDNWLRGAMLPLRMAPAKGRVVACCCKAEMAERDRPTGAVPNEPAMNASARTPPAALQLSAISVARPLRFFIAGSLQPKLEFGIILGFQLSLDRFARGLESGCPDTAN